MTIFRRTVAARKGFTLIELLIVIIIISILAGMMLLAVGNAVDKAEAAKIVSVVRTLKAAVLLYNADNNAWPPASTTLQLPDAWIASLEKYMDRSFDNSDGTTIWFASSSGTSNPFPGRLYIGIRGSYGGSQKIMKPGVSAALAGMAKEAGIIGNINNTLYQKGGQLAMMNVY